MANLLTIETLLRGRYGRIALRDRKRRPSEPLRWLDSHVGCEWDGVYADLVERFDTRSLGGRQVVYDGDRLWVVGVSEHSRRHAEFIVDDDNVLRRGLWFPAHRFRVQILPKGKKHRSRKRVDAWADDRKVGRRGKHLYWFVPVRRGTAGLISGYRQHVRLNGSETRFWKSLMPEMQEHYVFEKVGV